MPSSDRRVEAAELKSFLGSLLAAYGIAEECATQMADLLTWANLRGMDSHGARQVPRYIDLFVSGEVNRSPNMVETMERPALALLDADSAPGAVALNRATALGCDIARTQGVAWVQVAGMAHAGAIGYFAEKVANAGMIALVMLAGMPNMAYPGAKPAAVGTNPMAIGIPGRTGEPFLLDMATSSRRRPARRGAPAAVDSCAPDRGSARARTPARPGKPCAGGSPRSEG